MNELTTNNLKSEVTRCWFVLIQFGSGLWNHSIRFDSNTSRMIQRFILWVNVFGNVYACFYNVEVLFMKLNDVFMSCSFVIQKWFMYIWGYLIQFQLAVWFSDSVSHIYFVYFPNLFHFLEETWLHLGTKKEKKIQVVFNDDSNISCLRLKKDVIHWNLRLIRKSTCFNIQENSN